MSSGWHGESAENMIVRLDGSVEMVALRRKKVIIVEDGGCAWKAPTVPSVALPVVAIAAGFAVIGGF